MKQQTQNKIEWKELNFLNCLEKEASNNKLKLQQKEFLDNGKFPIIDQGVNFIAGYTNNESKVYAGKLPVVIFGDHTRILKFVNFPFALGADGVKILIPKENINPKYFYYAIQILKIKSLGYSRHYKLLKTKKIPLPFSNNKPDLKEQERIVSILEESEKLNKKSKNVEKLFDEYLKGVFYEMFGKIQLGNFDEEIIKIIDGDRGVNYPNGNDFSEKGYCLFLNTGNVRKNGFNFEKLMFITKEKDEQLRKGKAQIDDIILTTRGTIGNVALYNKTIPYRNIRINSGMVLLRTNTKKILPKFLEYLIQMPLIQNQFLKMNSGSAQPQLPITNLKKIGFPLPSLPLQQKFSKIVEQVEKMKEKINKTKQNSEELFNSLVSKGFRGEL